MEPHHPFWRSGSLWLMGIGMMGAGIAHFLATDKYVEIMPAYLPHPHLLVQVSGVAEFLGGLGLLVPATRRAASWGLILLFVAVFPANLNMVLHPGKVPLWVVWGRLPFQPLLIWWAYRLGLDGENSQPRTKGDTLNVESDKPAKT